MFWPTRLQDDRARPRLAFMATARGFGYHPLRCNAHWGDSMKIAAAVFAATALLTASAAQADAGEDLLKKNGCTA